MPPFFVIKGKNIIEDIRIGLLNTFIIFKINLLGFKGMEKTFHGRIIISAFSITELDFVFVCDFIQIVTGGIVKLN